MPYIFVQTGIRYHSKVWSKVVFYEIITFILQGHIESINSDCKYIYNVTKDKYFFNFLCIKEKIITQKYESIFNC